MAQAQALDEAKALGADVIRANVIWSRFAPSANSKKKPKGFDGKNPAAYPAGAFGMLDSFVAGAQARGMEVLLTATGPIPAWASRCGKGSVATLRTCKPDSKLFGAFVRALGTRYPTVKKWSIWNEPNLRSWLSPQYEAKGSQAVQTSAYLYRQLAASAIAGLRATGHRARPDLAGRDRAARRRPVRLQRPALAARARRSARRRSSRPRRRRSCAASSA